MNNNFRQDYEALGLDDEADWSTARNAYQRQVKQWHPDRYAQRPRERAHAQERFIQLTRAFDNLKIFYRENNRLPFEPNLEPPTSEHPVAGQVDPRVARATAAAAAANHGTAAHAQDFAPGARPTERDMQEADFLNLRSSSSRPEGPGLAARLKWPVIALSLVIMTLVSFLILDQSSRRAKLDEGIRLLQRTEPSEFMPSASEVKKQSGRGTFVEGGGVNRIGDQLMEDVFR